MMKKFIPIANTSGAYFETTVKLPTPPAVAMRIVETITRGNFSSQELSDLISIDPALTVKVLSFANSPFYSLEEKVNSVHRAVDVLGMNVVINIALSFSIIDCVRSGGAEGFDYEDFWKRSVIRAVAATVAAKFLGQISDDVFIVALLTDVGKVLMCLVRPDDYLRVLREVRSTAVKDYDIERQLFSYDHQDIGSETLKLWGIPETIYQPIACHHKDVNSNGKYADLLSLIQIGDLVSEIYVAKANRESMESLCVLMKDRYNLNATEVYSLVDEAASDAAGILEIFEIPPSQLRPFSELLQEANEQLFRLNLTYDQLMQRFAEEKAKAEMLANELREANQRLSELVGTDGLTGLCNYRYFHRQLHNEMIRSQRYMHSVSLIMIDVDNFKQVNDNHGHFDGDVVLKAVAGIIWEESRRSDTVARYGGEEFVVILPETDLKGAASFAERVRQKIETHTVNINGVNIGVTVSLGVCVCDPKKCKPNHEDFIKAVDKALYHSKSNGKNRLSVASL